MASKIASALAAACLAAVVCATAVSTFPTTRAPPAGKSNVSLGQLYGKNITLPGAFTPNEENVILYKNPEPLDVQKNEEEQGDGTSRRQQVYEDDPIFNFSWPSSYQTVVCISVIFVVTMIVCAAFVIKRIVKNSLPELEDMIDTFKIECSNHGLPCACEGYRVRDPPPPSDRRADAVPLKPMLPPRNGYNDGEKFVDHTGETTHVFTRIPVPFSTRQMTRRHYY